MLVFALQPLADDLVGLPFVVLLVSWFCYAALKLYIRVAEKDKEDGYRDVAFIPIVFRQPLLRTLKKTIIISALITLLIVPIAESWKTYKSVIMYKAVTSPTTEAAIKNADVFMSRVQEFLKEWNPKEKK